MKEDESHLKWDPNGQPISKQFGDVYFSKDNGLAETRYVFIDHNDLPQRFKALQPDQNFIILETGFGSGLNFFATWQCWQQYAPKGARLHFLSTELYPLSADEIRNIHQCWPELSPLVDAFLQSYPPPQARGFHRLHLQDNVCLTLMFGEVLSCLQQCLPIQNPGPNVQRLSPSLSATTPLRIDALFLDGFAPALNPDMWRAEIFTTLARLSSENTSFACFTAAGLVRKHLAQAGFQVCKVPGFGRKREMIRGHHSGSVATTSTPGKPDTSWHLVEASRSHSHNAKPKTIAVIGAGLAGCHTAFALAQRGYSVTLFDRNKVAAEASGNPQGVLYSKLSHGEDIYTDFNLMAYLFACRFYSKQELFEHCGGACGVLQLAQSEKSEERLRLIGEKFASAKSHFQFLSLEEASNYAGVPLNCPALLLRQSGWLSPPDVCQYLIRTATIQTINGTEVTSLQQTENGWALQLNSSEYFEADAVVIACSNSAKRFQQCASLPIKSIRGQITYAPADDNSTSLKSILCGEGYIAPTMNGQHCLGASFNLKSQSPVLTEEDHRQNLNNIAQMSPSLAGLKAQTQDTSGRVSFRCTTPDYLPVLGPVANESAMLATRA